MWSTLFYLFKLAVVIIGGLWLYSLQGEIVFAWGEYKVTAHLGFFLFAIALFVLLVTWVTRGTLFFAHLPKFYKYYRQEKRREKGNIAMLRSLSALSAGDGKIAAYQAFRAEKLTSKKGNKGNKGADGLALLLSAHAARLNGDNDEAQKRFDALANNKETALLGYQGMIKTAYEQGEESKALALAYQAYNKNVKSQDLLLRVYEMEIANHSWPAALKTVRKLESIGALDKIKARRDRAALLTQLGQDHLRAGQKAQAQEQFKSALKISPGFLPAALSLCGLYIALRQNKRAQRLIEKQWRIAPHPDLVKHWMALLPDRKLKKADARFEWVKRLAGFNTQDAESLLATARIAMEDGLWGEARSYLLKAEAQEPRMAVYRMLEDIAHRSDHDQAQAREWADKALDAESDPVWMCEETGRIYPEWCLLAMPGGDFNTIIWRAPRRMQISGISSPYGGETKLDLAQFIGQA